jgi:hypothetical protein
MASDDKKTKPVPKSETPVKGETPAKSESTSAAEPAKAAGETAGAAPSGYSRGEGQKPVSKAYKENWNVIFGKKKKR